MPAHGPLDVRQRLGSRIPVAGLCRCSADSEVSLNEGQLWQTINIDSGAIYNDAQLCRILGVRPKTIIQARRRNKLRYSLKGNRIFYLGQWVLVWIQDKPVSPPSDEETGNDEPSHDKENDEHDDAEDDENGDADNDEGGRR